MILLMIGKAGIGWVLGSGGLLCIFGNEICSNGVIESKGTGYTYLNGSRILTVIIEVPIEKCSAERCFRA